MTGSKKQTRATPGSADFNTLDEPIKETFVSSKLHYLILTMSWHIDDSTLLDLKLRDVRAVGQKFYHVLYPKEKNSLLKEW